MKGEESALDDDSAMKDKEETSFPFRIKGKNVTLIFPRNSKIREFAGIHCSQVCIAIGQSCEKWPLPSSTPQTYGWLFENLQEVPSYEKYEKSSSRYAVSIEGARIYTSRREIEPEASSGGLSWGCIRDGACVYESSEGPAFGLVHWKELTVENNPLHIRAIFDATESNAQLLVATPPDISAPFRLRLTMSQYCTLLSIWHCNLQEMAGRVPDIDMKKGPEHFCKYLSDSVVRGNTVVSIPHVDIEFHMHGEDFSYIDDECNDTPVVSTLCLARAMGIYWTQTRNERDRGCEGDGKIKEEYSTRLHKFARIRAEFLLIRISNGAADTRKVCINARALELRDLRPTNNDINDYNAGEIDGIDRQRIGLPHGAYRAGVNAENVTQTFSGGVMYADFGIFDVYDPLLDDEISGLQINIFMTPRRKRICVRIHDVDIATEDLNLVWLLTEFTSNFYNDERLENPDVLRYYEKENGLKFNKLPAPSNFFSQKSIEIFSSTKTLTNFFLTSP